MEAVLYKTPRKAWVMKDKLTNFNTVFSTWAFRIQFWKNTRTMNKSSTGLFQFCLRIMVEGLQLTNLQDEWQLLILFCALAFFALVGAKRMTLDSHHYCC